MANKPRSGLGRGLGSLIPTGPALEAAEPTDATAPLGAEASGGATAPDATPPDALPPTDADTYRGHSNPITFEIKTQQDGAARVAHEKSTFFVPR